MTALRASEPAAAAASQAANETSHDAQGEAQEGLRLYQARDFAAAERHLVRSLQLDSGSVETLFLLARTLNTEFRLSREESERSELARRAVTAYQDVLARDPGRGEAYQALLALAREADDAAALPWLERQAGDTALPPSRRADALQVLAGRSRACAERKLREISQQPVLLDSSTAARDCAMRGVASIQQALQLVPQRGSAWSEQARLLSTLAEVCALQGQPEQKAAYEKQAGDSRRKAEQIRVSESTQSKPPRSY
jgi:hypothetical protein